MVDYVKAIGYEVVQEPASLSLRTAQAQLVIIKPEGGFGGASDPRCPMGVAHSGR
jgi:hypothetical protein